MDPTHLNPLAQDGFARPEAPRDSHEEFLSSHVPSRPASPGPVPEAQGRSHHRKPRKIVLCFDGTGNKFHGDDSDSNILKIFRMLDRTASDQYHYYQPGIGTYVVSTSLTHTGTVARIKSWYMKAKDSAVGSSFDQHVVGGYRFLMRFYNPGDEIYIFGFSRGSYIARFLAEMLDYVGLLSHGNEEMVVFAWKAFSSWQSRQGNTTPEGMQKKKEMYTFMKGFRETFSRPVRRIRFLGLFDTVNSVPRFETAWMQRSKFPYTARTSAKVVRHAVSIDERRAKFRQDLMYQNNHRKKEAAKEHNAMMEKLHEVHNKYRRRASLGDASSQSHREKGRGRKSKLDIPEDPAPYRARSHSAARSRRAPVVSDEKSEFSVAPHPHGEEFESDSVIESEDEGEQDLDEIWFAGGHADIGGGWEMLPESKSASHVPLVWMIHEAMKAGLNFDLDKVRDLGCIDAIHDVRDPATANAQAEAVAAAAAASAASAVGANSAAAQPPIPNIMVRSPSTSTPKLFQRARFGRQNTNGEAPASPSTGAPANAIATTSSSSSSSSSSSDATNPPSFREMMHKAHTALIHDSLEFGGGLSWSAVAAWKVMEYLPFRRMDLQSDGSWKPIRWPLPCGEVRDIPADARIHGSVIRRMEMDPTYRPGNLIVGGGGRGVRRAPEHKGIGEWVCVEREGCPIGEVWMRRDVVEGMAAGVNGLVADVNGRGNANGNANGHVGQNGVSEK